MNAINIFGANNLQYVTLSPKKIQNGEIRILMAIAGLCGSDEKLINSHTSKIIPGHEFSGLVIEVSDSAINNFSIGDKVTAYPMITCMKCNFCLNLLHRECLSKKSLGFQIHGAFAEEIIIDHRFVVKLNKDISYEQGALIEHLACGYRLAKDISMELPDKSSRILIIGDGPIGLADIRFLKYFGYNDLTLIGKHANKILLGKKIGAKFSFFADEISKINNQQQFDVCIIAAQANEFLPNILNTLRDHGLVLPQTRLSSDVLLSAMHKKKIRIGKAFAYEFNDFYSVMNLISNNDLSIENLISRIVDLNKFPEFYKSLNKNNYSGKILIRNNNYQKTKENYGL